MSIKIFSILIITISIAFTGVYGEISSLEHDSRGFPNGHNTLLHVASTTYVLASEASGLNGTIVTFTISNDGNTITEIASFTHAASPQRAYDTSFLQIDSDTYVLAYTGNGTSGWISTFAISADGTTITEEATLNHSNPGRSNSLVHVTGNIFALAYKGSGNTGWITTFTIPTDGSSITEEASFEFYDTSISYISMVQVVVVMDR